METMRNGNPRSSNHIKDNTTYLYCHSEVQSVQTNHADESSIPTDFSIVEIVDVVPGSTTKKTKRVRTCKQKCYTHITVVLLYISIAHKPNATLAGVVSWHTSFVSRWTAFGTTYFFAIDS
mgnify:CR=1 FL=1|jgi:rare lipoprotein A (peptidoglycan hydrolase)